MKPAVAFVALLLTLPLTVQADTLASLEQEARNLLAQGQSLNRATGAGGACGQKMRTLQPQVKQLQSRIDALPRTSPDHSFLSIAATYLYLCVSCQDRLGPEQCSEAATYLGKMESQR